MTDVLKTVNNETIANNEANEPIYNEDEVNRLKEKYTNPIINNLPKLDESIKIKPIIANKRLQLKYEAIGEQNNVSLNTNINKENGDTKVKGRRIKRRHKKSDPLITGISELLSTSLSFISPEKAIVTPKLSNITINMAEYTSGTSSVISNDNTNSNSLPISISTNELSNGDSLVNGDCNDTKHIISNEKNSFSNITVVASFVESNCIVIESPTMEEKIKASHINNDTNSEEKPKRKSKLSLTNNFQKGSKNKFKECSQQTKLNGFFKISPTKVIKKEDNIEAIVEDKVTTPEKIEIIKILDEAPTERLRLSSSLFMSPKMKKQLKSKIKKDLKALDEADGVKRKHKKKKKQIHDDFEDNELKSAKTDKVASIIKGNMDEDQFDYTQVVKELDNETDFNEDDKKAEISTDSILESLITDSSSEISTKKSTIMEITQFAEESLDSPVYEMIGDESVDGKTPNKSLIDVDLIEDKLPNKLPKVKATNTLKDIFEDSLKSTKKELVSTEIDLKFPKISKSLKDMDKSLKSPDVSKLPKSTEIALKSQKIKESSKRKSKESVNTLNTIKSPKDSLKSPKVSKSPKYKAIDNEIKSQKNVTTSNEIVSNENILKSPKIEKISKNKSKDSVNPKTIKSPEDSPKASKSLKAIKIEEALKSPKPMTSKNSLKSPKDIKDSPEASKSLKAIEIEDTLKSSKPMTSKNSLKSPKYIKDSPEASKSLKAIEIENTLKSSKPMTSKNGLKSPKDIKDSPEASKSLKAIEIEDALKSPKPMTSKNSLKSPKEIKDSPEAFKSLTAIQNDALKSQKPMTSKNSLKSPKSLIKNEEKCKSPKEIKTDAFNFMMDRRNKVIGRNSPGKEIIESPKEEADPKELKKKLSTRKSKLEEWNNSKGAVKRKLDEADKEVCIEIALDKRAKRLKKMLKFDNNEDVPTNEIVNIETIVEEIDEDVISLKKRKRVIRIKSESENSINMHNLDSNLQGIEEAVIFETSETSKEPIYLDELSNHSPIRKKPKLLPTKPILIDDTVDVDVFKKFIGEETAPKVQTGLLSFFGVLKQNKTNLCNGDEEKQTKETFKIKMCSPQAARRERRKRLSLKKKSDEQFTQDSSSCDEGIKPLNIEDASRDVKLQTILEESINNSNSLLKKNISEDSSSNDTDGNKKRSRKKGGKNKPQIINESGKIQLGFEKSNVEDGFNIVFSSLKKSLKLKMSLSDASNSNAMKEEDPEIVSIEENVAHTPRRSTRVRVVKIYDEKSQDVEEIKNNKKCMGSMDEGSQSQDGGKLKKKNKKKKCIESMDEASQSQDSEKFNKKNKKEKKIAAIFLNSAPKPMIDPAILEARRNFLYSGVPSTLKKKIEKQESIENIEYDVFPSTSHVQQKPDNPSQFWALPPINLKLNELSNSPPKIGVLKFGSVTNCQDNNAQDVHLNPPKDLNNFKTHLQEIKSNNPDYPVYKTFRLLREKNGYRFDQDPYIIPETPVEIIKINKKRGRPKKLVKDEPIHVIENEIVDITQTQCIDINIADYSMWTEKYKPKSSEDIIGNQSSLLELKSWLKSWIDYSVELEGSKMRRRKDSSSDFESNDGESRDGMRLPGNTVILRGPPGSGKTSAIYAVCNELAINVLELNASSKRTGKRLLQELQEATQSHQVRNNANPFNSFINKPNKSDAPNSKMCLLLVEDVDIVFDQDDGFISALNQLVVTSKRPIVLVTTNVDSAHLQKFIMQYPVLSFVALSARTLSVWLQILCLLEGVKVEKSSIGELLEWNKGDIRRTLLQLQFWVQTGGESLANYAHNSSVCFYRNSDELREKFVDYVHQDEACDLENVADHEEPIRVHSDCITSFLVMRRDCFSLPYPLNLGNLWWNLPNLLNFPHIHPTKANKSPDLFEASQKSSLTKLNNIFQVFDALSLSDSMHRSEAFDLEAEPCSKNWETVLLDSLELEENLNQFKSSRYLTKQLTHTLIEGHCKLFKTEDERSSINMAAPIPEERRWRNKRHECQNTFEKIVPTFFSLDRSAIALDYFPSLRTISRSESIRSSTNQKRGNRFYNYLRTLNIQTNTSTINTASNIFKL